jgi:CAAX protease family protein
VRLRHARRHGIGRLRALGFAVEPRDAFDAAAGLVIAALAIGAVFAAGVWAGLVVVDALRSPSTLAADLGSMVASAATEELVFRSLLLGGLLVVFPDRPGQAVVISAAIFGAIHAFNPNATTLAVIGSTIGGVCYGIAFAVTERVWMSIGLHFGWNYSMGPVFGFPVSGAMPIHPTLVAQRGLGPSWLTGGAYGPEAGAIGLLGRAAVVTLTIAYLSWIVRHRGPAAPADAVLPSARPASDSR